MCENVSPEINERNYYNTKLHYALLCCKFARHDNQKGPSINVMHQNSRVLDLEIDNCQVNIPPLSWTSTDTSSLVIRTHFELIQKPMLSQSPLFAESLTNGNCIYGQLGNQNTSRAVTADQMIILPSRSIVTLGRPLPS
ncbi:hypothetical protein TNCV_195301 [Trichonephila clavipes]|uniref:Uncharacterized protein n=1 Tax=Trichonephila clavipes TaxID=2585209 RepID=A0A8X6WHZ2_TRICX|nr:hypothetical protein TNCV_195301 [Trichonephila clavipes]